MKLDLIISNKTEFKVTGSCFKLAQNTCVVLLCRFLKIFSFCVRSALSFHPTFNLLLFFLMFCKFMIWQICQKCILLISLKIWCKTLQLKWHYYIQYQYVLTGWGINNCPPFMKNWPIFDRFRQKLWRMFISRNFKCGKWIVQT